MNKPILSICIPTYNRAQYLAECLDSIVCQFDDEEIYKNIEIIISDNASEDNTKEIVQKYSEQFNNIFYYKNESNLGYDRNVSQVIYFAKGNFIWTISDDEIIKENSLKFLFGVIAKYPDVSWICVDNRTNSVQEIEVYGDGNEWLKEMKLAGGQISQNIFNRIYLPTDINKYFGNFWIHYSLAREVSAHRKQLLVKSLFKLSETERLCRWAKDGHAFFTYISLYKIIGGLSLLGYDKEIIGVVLKDMANGLPRQIASAKLQGLKVRLSHLKMLFINFYKYPVSLLLCFFIMISPRSIIYFVRSLWLKS